MYTLAVTKHCRKQIDRLRHSGRHDMKKMDTIVHLLLTGQPLPEKYRDHPLHGIMKDRRECHIAPDWLLIYQIHHEILSLELVATGSHSELF